MSDLITKTDAIDAVHKAIGELIDALPTKDMDGEKVYADTKGIFTYLEANKAVCNALRDVSSWHTEDPEESGEYLVTYEFTYNGKVYRKITIAEWATHSTNCDGDIIEFGEWFIDLVGDVVAWMPLPEEYLEDWK